MEVVGRPADRASVRQFSSLDGSEAVLRLAHWFFMQPSARYPTTTSECQA